MWKWMGFLGAFALAVSLPSCVVHGHGHGHSGHVHGGVEIALPVAHVCSTHCGHYQYRGKWFHRGGHVHGHGCGHIFVGGVWRID